jgi:hypothetical protein
MATTKTGAKKTATQTPAAKKSTPKAAPRKRAPVKKAAQTATAAREPVSSEVRYRMIQEAAYHLAERNGFHGDPTAYWIAAEAQIAKQLDK